MRRGGTERRLIVDVALGVLASAVYVLFDVLAENRLRSGTLTGTLASAHDVIDHVFPLLVGGLLGVCVHYLRVRARLSIAEEAAARSDALRSRLHKVERDQAVWVLAAAVLHELNNPLHALGLLLDELATGEPEGTSRRDLVERARAQTDRALKHLQTLRSMRALGEPEFQRIALDRVIAGVADDMRSLASEDGLEVRVDCAQPVQASADPGYVRTILENLVDNSMCSLRGMTRDRARTRGLGCITIRVATEDGRAVVRVSDDGPALEPDVRSTLFEPLRTTKTHGLGLGLPIARALARSMRGDLVFDEGADKVFRLELPLRAVP